VRMLWACRRGGSAWDCDNRADDRYEGRAARRSGGCVDRPAASPCSASAYDGGRLDVHAGNPQPPAEPGNRHRRQPSSMHGRYVRGVSPSRRRPPKRVPRLDSVIAAPMRGRCRSAAPYSALRAHARQEHAGGQERPSAVSIRRPNRRRLHVEPSQGTGNPGRSRRKKPRERPTRLGIRRRTAGLSVMMTSRKLLDHSAERRLRDMTAVLP